MKAIKILSLLVIIIGVAMVCYIELPNYQIQKYKSKQNTQEKKNEKGTVQYTFIETLKKSPKKEFQVLGLGDSIIKGVGSENGGFLPIVTNELQTGTHKTFHLVNEGISGYRSTQLKEYLYSGVLDEKIQKSDIIVVNIGGNDVLSLSKKKGIMEVFSSFGKIKSTYEDNLKDIASYIYNKNPNAYFVFLELYNPTDPEEKYYSITKRLLPQWNSIIYETAYNYPNSIVIETTKVMKGEDRNLFYIDKVHPSSAGYEKIAEQVSVQFEEESVKEE